MYVHILWLKMDGLLYKLIGFAPKSLEPELEQTARSLRSLTDGERKAIEVYTLRIVQANKNENLEDLSKRTDNVVSANITAIMNGLEVDAKLNRKQDVKIVIKEKVFSIRFQPPRPDGHPAFAERSLASAGRPSLERRGVLLGFKTAPLIKGSCPKD